MRILGARIFLSVLAGKFYKTEQLFTKTMESQNINLEHAIGNQTLLNHERLRRLKLC